MAQPLIKRPRRNTKGLKACLSAPSNSNPFLHCPSRLTLKPSHAISRAPSSVAVPCSALDWDIFFDSHGIMLDPEMLFLERFCHCVLLIAAVHLLLLYQNGVLFHSVCSLYQGGSTWELHTVSILGIYMHKSRQIALTSREKGRTIWEKKKSKTEM